MLKKINFEYKKNQPFYFFIIGVFLLIVSPNLFSDGMFMDGLIYSTVAKNLSNGIGTFWNPHFTATCKPEFHDHPPLAMGIQSVFFTIFGESRYIDKLYSLCTFIIVGYLIVKIWRVLKFKFGWLPLLFWLTIPLVIWACSNNMLENTMSVFITLSVLFYLKSQNTHTYSYLFLSGIMLSLGFLTKGFFTFFPWTLPFLWWLFIRRKPFRNMVFETLIVLFSSILPLILLVLFFPDIRLSLQKYLDMQVIHSLKNMTTVDSRFFIVNRLFSEMIPAACLVGIFIFYALHKKNHLNGLKSNSKLSITFIFFGLTGVLPIMISMKQSGFYMLSTFPFFAIGIAIFIYPLVTTIFKNINSQTTEFLIFKWIGIGCFLTGILMFLYFSQRIGRDKNKIKDTYCILNELPSNSIINITRNMRQDWSLHGYFGRYKNVSLDTNFNRKRKYLLIQTKDYSDTLLQNYTTIPLPTIDYKLFKLRECGQK